MTCKQNETLRILRLVTREEAIRAVELLEHIRPLPNEVRPSTRFLEETRGRLLHVITGRNGHGLAA
jgi:hypothetical protein